jgi:squalene-hopene/tetraprenyl-beta-curcumene cyclase
MQPRTGGFLEATPLTGFVTLCLEGSGHRKHPVSLKACEFLTRSIREDCGWPIDTHLATWVTTLAIKALSDAWDKSPLSQERRAQVRSWLLGQQHVTEHPFTHAAPGGWAWTPLAGGVPDGDDTPGALLALRRLGPVDEQARRAGHMGCRWLIKLQNSDGGLPTFCRGWGKLPFDRSCPDLTAHAIRAWSEWREYLEDPLRSRLDQALVRGWAYLEASQRQDGAWLPLWFGNEDTEKHINPVYGTSQVILGLKEARFLAGSVRESLARAAHFLTQVQNPDGGWGGGCGAPSSVEETALATEALMGFGQTHQESFQRGLQWILARVKTEEFKPAPIGLYFASLWYSEEMYPWVFALSCLRHAEENLL